MDRGLPWLRAGRDTGRAMSQENVEIVLAAFDAYFRGETDAVLRLCDENIVITQPAEVPGLSPQQRGHAGVLEAFGMWPEEWDEYSADIERVLAHPGDYVVVAIRSRGRGPQSGVEVTMEFTFAFTVRDGKITEWRIFARQDQALEAVGLRE
jgi:ketosteroid isomerase-like protein